MDFPNRSRRLNHSVPRKASVGESVAENIPEVGEIPDKVRNEVDVRNTVPLENVAGNVVCLGKFDALHLGHRALAERGATIGQVYMLSFSNMAEVLGWEPRLPLLASCHRPAVLRQWASVCGGTAPQEVLLDFRTVRSLSPEAFVDLLADQLRVKGVVAGDNYRFGFKAAGDASALLSLGEARGLAVAVVGSISDCGPHCAPSRGEPSDRKISSTRVRQALGRGDMACVEQLLGRPHQLAAWIADPPREVRPDHHIALPRSSLLNEPPCCGSYDAVACILPAESSHRAQDARQEDSSNGLKSLKVKVTVHIQADDLVIDLGNSARAKEFGIRLRTSRGPHILSLEFSDIFTNAGLPIT